MAVSRMRKVQILAHNAAKDAIVASLRECGVIHITEPAPGGTADRDEELRRATERELQTRLSKLEHIKDFLKPYLPKEKRSLESMLNPRVEVGEVQLRAMLQAFDLDSLYARVVEVEGTMRSAEADIARKESLAGELRHWSGLDAPIETLKGTALTALALVAVEASALSELRDELAEATRESEVFEVSIGGSQAYVAAVYLRSEEPRVTPVLKRHGARTANLADAKGRPDEAAKSLLTEAAALRESIDALKKDAATLALRRRDVLVILDETREQLARTTIQEKFASTRDTFMLEGWMRAADEDAVRERLRGITTDFEMAARDPERDEDVPIDLSNGSVVRPFEFVTTLYGRPSYQERDPTPLLAPFFILVFGLCVSDAGYGVTLAAVSFFFMMKMRPGSGRQLM
jgi:V/A-type H+-transporting ATPase subunit I